MSQFTHQWIEKAEENQYFARLTGNPFLFTETRTLLKMMKEVPNPKNLRSMVSETNAFHYKSTKSIPKRVNSIIKRYRFVPEEVREFIYSASAREAQKIAFLVLTATDRLLRDFLRDVVLQKHYETPAILTQTDFQRFFIQRTEIDDKVGQWSEPVIKKLQNIIISILIEVGICTKRPQLNIQKVILDQSTREFIITWFPTEYLAYLEGP